MIETYRAEKVQVKPVETATVLIIKDNYLLTVRHKAGTTAGEGVTGLPGGKKIEGEDDRETAIRKLKEETGLSVKHEDLFEFPGNFFEADLRINAGKLKHATMRVFMVSKFNGELKIDSRGTNAQWTKLRLINNGFYETLPNVLQVIKNAQDFLKNG